MAKTTNYNLQKDSDTDFYSVNTVNNNLDLIDSAIKNVENSIPESLPANGGNSDTVGNIGIKLDNTLGLHKIQASTTDIGVGSVLESGTIYVVYEG